MQLISNLSNTTSAPMLMACSLLLWSGATIGQLHDERQLQALAYLAADTELGSYLRTYPGQRTAFGLPDEPLSAVGQYTVSYPDLEKEILSAILHVPIDAATTYVFPKLAGPVGNAADLVQREKNLRDNPHDPAAHTKMFSALLKGGSALSSSARLGLWGSLISKQVDYAVVIGEAVRARVLQNRALSLVPSNLVSRTGDLNLVEERIGSRAGAFYLQGRNLTAQGGWELDHGDGVRSRSYARYDFSNKFLPSGAIVSTVGNAPRRLPLEERSASTSPVDWILNTYGNDSNWIGRNVTGGNHAAFEIDEWGYFPLGNTTIPGKDIHDSYARLHDIEYYVSTHFPKGTEVRVPGPNGDEFFTSTGTPTNANNKVMAKVASSLSAVGLIHAMISRNYEGRRTSENGIFVELNDKSKMNAPAYNAGTRREYLAQPPGGVFRDTTIAANNNGITVTKTSRESYRISYSGAAVSAAVEEYNRTGVYDIAKHYRNTEFASSSGTGPHSRQSGAPSPTSGPPSIKPGSQHPQNVGGVWLSPNNRYSISGDGIRDSQADLLGAAAASLTFDTPTEKIEINGQTYTVVRATAQNKCNPNLTLPTRGTLIGRFSFYQTDLLLEAPAGLALRRFFNSDHPSGEFWSWQPYQLLIGSNAITLFDRQASRVTEYKRNSDGGWQVIDASGSDNPTLRKLDSGNLAIAFANGFSAEFSPGGQLTRTGNALDSRDHITFVYAEDATRETRRVAADGSAIEFHYDGAGFLTSAVASNGQQIDYQRDIQGRLVSTQGSYDGAFYFGYDSLGRVTTARIGRIGPIVFQNQYDAAGRLLTHAVKDSKWNFEYAALGAGRLRVSVDGGDSNVTSYLFDSKQRLTAYGDLTSRMTVLNYDSDGHVIQIASGQSMRKLSACIEPEIEISQLYTPL